MSSHGLMILLFSFFTCFGKKKLFFINVKAKKIPPVFIDHRAQKMIFENKQEKLIIHKLIFFDQTLVDDLECLCRN